MLETETLGFPGLTPQSALALRALIQHGYRPVVATGRSLAEVRERCEAYRLAGAVAEYGAVIYNHETGSVQEILSERERADLERIRSALCNLEGVLVDSDYHYAVRAYRLDPSGRRHGLNSDLISSVLAESQLQDRVRSIQGEAQTDLMVVNVNKGIGLRRLVHDLGTSDQIDGTRPLALAVGDTVSDLPMFDLATLACAPAHADPLVRAAGIAVMKQPYQAGLALAAARLLKHRPGQCPTVVLQTSPLKRSCYSPCWLPKRLGRSGWSGTH